MTSSLVADSGKSDELSVVESDSGTSEDKLETDWENFNTFLANLAPPEILVLDVVDAKFEFWFDRYVAGELSFISRELRAIMDNLHVQASPPKDVFVTWQKELSQTVVTNYDGFHSITSSGQVLTNHTLDAAGVSSGVVGTDGTPEKAFLPKPIKDPNFANFEQFLCTLGSLDQVYDPTVAKFHRLWFSWYNKGFPEYVQEDFVKVIQPLLSQH